MTDKFEDQMFDRSAAAVIHDLASAGQEPTVLEPGMIHSWFSPNGHVQLVDLTDDKYLDEPKRKRGTTHVLDIPSFAAYYQKHKVNGESEIYANPNQYTVTGVLNAHAENAAHWQDHKVILKLATTPEWQAWSGLNRQMLAQVDFAEFIEDHAADIGKGEVTAAQLLEMAQKVTATVNVQFSSGTRLRDGQTELQYIESIDQGGKPGSVKIPPSFNLAIRPFDDCDATNILARIRYRVMGKALKLGYFIDNPEKIVRDAMDYVIVKVGEATGDTVLLGTSS